MAAIVASRGCDAGLRKELEKKGLKIRVDPFQSEDVLIHNKTQVVYVNEVQMSEDPMSCCKRFDDENKRAKQRVLIVHRASFHARKFLSFQECGIHARASVVPALNPGHAAALVVALKRAKPMDKSCGESAGDANLDDRLIDTAAAIPGVPVHRAAACLREHKSIAGFANSLAAADDGELRAKDRSIKDFFMNDKLV